VTADLNEWDVLIGRVSGRWDYASLKVQAFSQTPSHFDAGRSCASLRRLVGVC
jgi:hypothetical protein